MWPQGEEQLLAGSGVATGSGAADPGGQGMLMGGSRPPGRASERAGDSFPGQEIWGVCSSYPWGWQHRGERPDPSGADPLGGRRPWVGKQYILSRVASPPGVGADLAEGSRRREEGT